MGGAFRPEVSTGVPRTLSLVVELRTRCLVAGPTTSRTGSPAEELTTEVVARVAKRVTIEIPDHRHGH